MKEQKRTKKGEELTKLVLKLFEVYGVLMSHGEKITSPMGETSARWKVLGAASTELLTVSQIARRMGLSRQAVLKTVNSLKGSGLVEPVENIDNIRSPKIQLTKSGQKTLCNINQVQIEWINQVSTSLKLSSIQATISELEAFQEALESYSFD